MPDFSATELPQDRALRLGAERLQRTVAVLPGRYAPFFGRLAELWQTPESAVLEALTRAAEPHRWQRTLLSSLERFDVELPGAPPDQHAHLLRFQPGAVFPLHQHQGSERVLVLEGSYADDKGHQAQAGDLQTMAPGSEHRLHILGHVPCVAAVSEHGVSFVTPWLRRLLRR